MKNIQVEVYEWRADSKRPGSNGERARPLDLIEVPLDGHLPATGDILQLRIDEYGDGLTPCRVVSREFVWARESDPADLGPWRRVMLHVRTLSDVDYASEP